MIFKVKFWTDHYAYIPIRRVEFNFVGLHTLFSHIKFSHIWFFHIHLLLFGKVYECYQPFKRKYSDAHEYCIMYVYVFTQTDLTFLTRQD
jgi:hypothetical protein